MIYPMSDIHGCYDKYMMLMDELKLKDDDILMITADHGCDPVTPSTDHSREYIPLVVYGRKLKAGVNLGTRDSFADIGATILDYFGLDITIDGKSFLPEIIGESE